MFVNRFFYDERIGEADKNAECHDGKNARYLLFVGKQIGKKAQERFHLADFDAFFIVFI